MILPAPTHPLEVQQLPLPERLWHLQPFTPDVLCRSTVGVRRVTALGDEQVSAWPEQPGQTRALHTWPQRSRGLALELLVSAQAHGAAVALNAAGDTWTATVRLSGFPDPHHAQCTAPEHDHPALQAVTAALLLAFLERASTQDATPSVT